MIKPILLFLIITFIPALKANQIDSWNLNQDSKNNLYNIDLQCEHPPTLSSFQKCYFTLSNKSEKISNQKIMIEGGMPKHHHGLPTAPKIIWNEKNKYYDINGLKFSMPGAWQLTFLIDKTEEHPRDTVTFNFKID